MNLLGFIMSLVYMQAVHGWLSAYEQLVNSQNFFSPYLTQEDMSRIGRDYLQVGFYTEIMFKEKEVHFIAIANGVDNQKRESSEFAPFLNIMKNKVRSGKVICDFSFFGRFGTINRCFLRSCGMFAIRYRRPSAIGSAVAASAEM